MQIRRGVTYCNAICLLQDSCLGANADASHAASSASENVIASTSAAPTAAAAGFGHLELPSSTVDCKRHEEGGALHNGNVTLPIAVSAATQCEGRSYGYDVLTVEADETAHRGSVEAQNVDAVQPDAHHAE